MQLCELNLRNGRCLMRIHSANIVGNWTFTGADRKRYSRLCRSIDIMIR